MNGKELDLLVVMRKQVAFFLVGTIEWHETEADVSGWIRLI